MLVEQLLRRAGEPVGRPDVHAQQFGVGSHRHPGRPPDEGVAAGRARDRDHDPFARLPRTPDAVVVHVVLQRLVDLVRHPEQGELPERGEVAGTEVIAERGVDAVRRIDVPVGHAAPERLRRHVDELDLLGGPDDRVGNRLVLLDPGDALDDVVDRLEVLHVERRDDVDAGVDEFGDVLPSLLVP